MGSPRGGGSLRGGGNGGEEQYRTCEDARGPAARETTPQRSDVFSRNRAVTCIPCPSRQLYGLLTSWSAFTLFNMLSFSPPPPPNLRSPLTSCTAPAWSAPAHFKMAFFSATVAGCSSGAQRSNRSWATTNLMISPRRLALPVREGGRGGGRQPHWAFQTSPTMMH